MAREVRVKFTGDTSNLEHAFRNMAATGEKAEGVHTKVANKLGRLDEVVGGATASLEIFGEMVGEGVRSAVDLGEQINKTGVVFGKSSQEVINFSKTTAGSLGISQEAALEAAGTFGNMLVPMGFAKGKAADMSTSLVKLAADMASFNNASPEETLDALRSGLAGETEPLRRFGVFLSQARVQAFALANGIVKPTKNMAEIKVATQKFQVAQDKLNEAIKEHGKDSDEAKSASIALAEAQKTLTKATKGSVPQLTAAQKAAATYGVVMHDTKAAQGDFGRTSSSLANQQRILSAEFTDLRSHLFRALLPTIQTVGQVFTSLLVIFEHHTTLAKVLGVAMAGLAVAFLIAAAAEKVQGSALTTNVTKLVKWVKTTDLAATATKAQAAAQAVLNAVMDANVIVLIVVALVALAAALVLAYRHSETFRNIVQGAFKKVQAVAGAVADFIRAHWKALLVAITGPFGVAALVVIAHWHAISNAVGAVVSFIRSHWQTIVAIFTPTLAVMEKVRSKWGTIRSAASTALGPVKTALDAVRDALATVWSYARQVVDTISKIHMPDIPGSGAASSVYHAVFGATGGIVTRPTLATIGEAGPEAVIPLDHTPGSMPLSRLTHNLTGGSAHRGGYGGGGPLVHIDHAEFHGPADAELVAETANRRLLRHA